MKQGALVLADIANDNLGDYAIFRSLSAILLEAGYRHVYKLSVESVPGQHVSLIKYYNPFAVLKALRHSDSVYVGGGGIFQDDTSVLNLVYFSLFTGLARLFRKKIIIKAVGVSPLHSKLAETIVAFICASASSISVRDEGSKEQLRRLFAGPIEVEQDLAFFYTVEQNLGSTRAALSELAESKYILVSLRPLLAGGAAEYSLASEEFLSVLSAQLHKVCSLYGAKPLFVPFHRRQDNAFICHFLQHYYRGEYLHEPGITVEDYLLLAENAQFVISMRLHAAILAHRCDTSVIALSYNYKVESFMRSIGGANRCIDIGDIECLSEVVKTQLGVAIDSS